MVEGLKAGRNRTNLVQRESCYFCDIPDFITTLKHSPGSILLALFNTLFNTSLKVHLGNFLFFAFADHGSNVLNLLCIWQPILSTGLKDDREAFVSALSQSLDFAFGELR